MISHAKKRKYRNLLFYSILIADICVLYGFLCIRFQFKKVPFIFRCKNAERYFEVPCHL